MVLCFLLILKKRFKNEKNQSGESNNSFVFFNINENRLMIGLSWLGIWLRKKLKMNDHSIESRGLLLWKYFFVVFGYLNVFCCFWIIPKLWLELSEREK